MRVAITPNPYADGMVAWTAKMLDASQVTADMLGVSTEAIVGQAAQESGWGKAAIGNNVFGIKADKAWTGAKQLVWTYEYVGGKYVRIQDWFRDYPTLAEGVQDHFNFLKDNSNYAPIFNGKHSDEEYFNLLKAGGYATDPNYVVELIGMVSSVKLVEKYITFKDS